MMKHISAALFASLLFAAPALADEEECQGLFVHSAQKISMDGSSLTMEGVSPSVIFFCDRPTRLAGHMSIEEFLSTVSTGEDSFAEDPPNASLSILSGDDVIDLVVELRDKPTVKGDVVTYGDVQIIDGKALETAGAGTLFIDNVRVRRRHVRRARRRCAAGVTC